ncbi:DUF4232 domain-containing protein [Streptomyces sudanensis]|uniref:DUF4232 domain-containing protein n=1 Tax=Streptomyces sudanensis TaxID=436397 RepID=UPI0020CD5237|nr:DUF4232 domain-containing protein [Streptomyces sudanensis]MCP9957862.1 DUF4232 domain-containing protein [Streptomyces sudanensis]MCQ0001603.1 DUF4232 domain-containing protein [Streptomyces sudanensis]
MRTFRTRTTTAAATALLAALSLTACQNDRGLGAAPATEPASSATSAPGAPAESASPAGTGSGTGDGRNSGTGNGTAETGTETGTGTGTDAEGTTSGSSAGKNSSTGHKSTTGTTGTTGGGKVTPVSSAPKGTSGASSFATCTGDNTRVSVVRPTRPINHLLITATNTGSRTCLAYGAPLLRFDDEQATPQLMEESHPQAVVTLAPGESAYAAVLLSGERAPEEANGRFTKRLTVLFSSRDASGSVGSPVTVKLPAGTYKTDDAAVTYWQSSLDDALGF